MNINFTENHIKAREEFKKFVDNEIIPFAWQYDTNEKISDDIIKKLFDSGYLGGVIPVEYGGGGMDFRTLGILNEEIGRGCSSIRSLLTVQGMVALSILKWGSIDQKNRYLPKMASGGMIGGFALTEPERGSDAKHLESTAQQFEDYFILNGKKKWITFGQIADLFLVFCMCEGKPTAFLVEKDTPGLTVKALKNLLGVRASMLAEITFKDCKIPKHNLLGNIGIGLSHVGLTALDYGRYTIALGCVGIAQACLDEVISYTSERKQFGVTLNKHQLVQKILTEIAVETKSARLMCYHAACLKDDGDLDSIVETWKAKYYASKVATKASIDAVQLLGANGCSDKYPVERFMRDAKIMEIIEGTSQIHEVLIASNIRKNMR